MQGVSSCHACLLKHAIDTGATEQQPPSNGEGLCLVAQIVLKAREAHVKTPHIKDMSPHASQAQVRDQAGRTKAL